MVHPHPNSNNLTPIASPTFSAVLSIQITGEAIGQNTFLHGMDHARLHRPNDPRVHYFIATLFLTRYTNRIRNQEVGLLTKARLLTPREVD